MGGSMGLYLGGSVLTLFELIDLILLLTIDRKALQALNNNNNNNNNNTPAGEKSVNNLTLSINVLIALMLLHFIS